MARRTLEQFEHKLQDYLEQLKVAEYTQFNRVIQDITKLLTSAINELDGDISTMRRVALEKFIRGVAAQQKKAMDAAIKAHMERLQQFGSYSYQIEASAMAFVTGASVVHSTRARAIYKAALDRPIGATGELLEPFVQGLTQRQVSTVENLLRKAHINGWTNKDTIQTLRGTKAKNYADGLMSRLGKQNATVVRTAMQHVNNSARQVVWADNADIVTGYKWLSTLDDRTSEECQDLDGEIFPIGEGPVPPAHPNCRSTTVAILDNRFDALQEGRTRSSVDGYVPFDMTYAEWLKEQDE